MTLVTGPFNSQNYHTSVYKSFIRLATLKYIPKRHTDKKKNIMYIIIYPLKILSVLHLKFQAFQDITHKHTCLMSTQVRAGKGG